MTTHFVVDQTQNYLPQYEIRDGFYTLIKRLLTTVQMINNYNAVEREIENIIPHAPTLRPFDLSIKLDHILTDGAWRSSLNRIGFDVTLISSNVSSSKQSLINLNKETEQRLCEKEKAKFMRKSHTDEGSGIILTGDEQIGEIFRHNNALVPIAVTEFGQLGSLFNRFFIWNRHPSPSSYTKR